ncbi:uncharacterized protein LOC116608461 isoform X2 [Nematostella vectensis]|uniref:uncharacterized protein LOC116608461 isoform X2 n=1 Tax=Nematostella vectensis TaxID=45351 RepID=UPI002076D614|nr:uncharacterized protein LOC116608461 isoform X2 [Nematostella vectensis]
MVRNIKEPVALFQSVILCATDEITGAIHDRGEDITAYLKSILMRLNVEQWDFIVSAQERKIASTFLDKLVDETDEKKITEEKIINELYQIAKGGIKSDVLRKAIEDYRLDRRGLLERGSHYAKDIAVKIFDIENQRKIKELLSLVKENKELFALLFGAPLAGAASALVLQRVQSGSITFIVRAQSLAALKELWSMYQTGELKRRFQEAFAKILDGQEIKFSVFIDENEFRSICLNLVHLSRAEFVSSGEAERPEKRRALSISSVDDLDREVREKQELIRCMREVEDAAQREKEKRKAIEADMAQMVQENTSKIVDKLKNKELTEKEREELLKLLVNHHKALLENVFCFEDSLRDKELDSLTNIVHYLSNSVENVHNGKEELAKLIPKYHEIMIKTIEQDPSSEKSYQALRDTTHDLFDGLRYFDQAKEEHAKLIPKYHEIMIKTIEQDPTSDKSYGELKEMMCELQKLTSSSEIGKEEYAKLIPKYHEIMIKTIEQDPTSDKSYKALRDTTHYLLDGLRDFDRAKEEHAKLIPKYHEIMIKNIEQDPTSDKSYQALRDTTHDLLDGLRDFDQAKEEHAKLIPKYHEIMIKTIEQDPTSDKSYGELKEMMCELKKLTSSSEIGKEEYAKLIPKYHEIVIKIIEQDPKIEKSYQALRDTTRDLASIARDLPDKGKEEVTEILVKYHTFLLKNIEQEPMSEGSHNALIAATHDLSKIVASWVTDEGKQQLAKLLPQYYTTLFTNIKQDPMSESSFGALKTATDDVLQMCRSSEIVKQEMIKFIPKHNENLLWITKRVVNESGSTDSGLDRLERVISILTSLVEPPSQDNQIILDLIDKMADKISQDTDSGKGLDRIERMVGNLVRFLRLSSLTDAGKKQLIELIEKLCNPLMHLEKPYVTLRIIHTFVALCENLSGPISDRIVTSLLSVIEAASRSNSNIPPPDSDLLDRLCDIVIERMELTPIDKEELSCILTSLNKCFAALAAEIASPKTGPWWEDTRQGQSDKLQFIMDNLQSMLDKQMKAFEEMIRRLQTSGV